jgi:ABC-type Mn2+/Zn2+ transport system ATPase subunit
MVGSNSKGAFLMEIVIRNCNSIDEAKITIEEGKLNIKYGINGTGKSTISKAIELNSKPGSDLAALTPFKFKDKNDDERFRPAIIGADTFKSISVFNEDYINQFVFKQDEVIQDSFNIFVKNTEYDRKMDEIEKLVLDTKDAFKDNRDLENIIKDLGNLSEAFGKSKDGYSKAGRIGKGIGSGNKIENIPDGLEAYTDFIKSETNVKWIKWQIEGNEFLEISSDCPYCISPLQDKKEVILSISEKYDAKSIEHLNALCSIIERLGKYFSEKTIVQIKKIINNKTGLEREEKNFLIELKNQVDTLKGKLSDMKYLSFFSFKDGEEVVEKIKSLQVNVDLLPHLSSKDTKRIVDMLNQSLGSVISKANLLQGEVNKQKRGIEDTIKKHEQEINEFLKYAGYKYSIHIHADGESYKMKLQHEDLQQNIENATAHLSYGEKNAFSLVLFMYESLTKNPDLIILDDPISSFDRNKKFAIVEMIFRGRNSLRGKSVLMMTHDLEPIIDMIKNLSHTFDPTPAACFLESKAGIVSEIKVSKSDIISFTQVCNENIAEHQEEIIQLIYLRRYYEILDDKGMEYQLLSNLFKKRTEPTVKELHTEIRIMTKEEIDSASNCIRKKLANFNYVSILKRISDKENMLQIYKLTNNNYEKLQLFRIINVANHNNDVVKKFINETFHIENEYMMQLNPHKYDFVPEHIIDECNKILLGG